jgi:predicted phage terminase large subunit-like protein
MGSPRYDTEAVRRFGFSEFVKLAWPQVVGDDLIWEPHMQLLCAHYEAVYRCEISDLVVNVPPGTSKSTISSILFPAWCWIMDARMKLLYTTYDQALSHDFARTTLELVLSEWFQARWPHVQIERGERANVGDYYTTAGGRRISTMMGGAATGKHAHILFVDDPHKPDDLEGDPDAVRKVLELAWKRWINTFSKRRANAKTFRRVCIMQRLHEEDLAGRMLKRPETVHLCLPMEYEPHRHCRTKWGEDYRTVEGQLLCPLRFPAEVVNEDRVEMTPRDFAAQHQQLPRPAEGALFKVSYFENRWSIIPADARRWIISVDANLKDRKDSDFCSIQVWCMVGPDYYLIDRIKGRWTYGDAVEAIRRMKRKWPQVGNVVIETKANGQAIIQSLKEEMSGIIEADPLGGKLARAESVEWLARAGNVIFPAAHVAPWIEEYLLEWLSFPVGSKDDDVDAGTQALSWLSAGRKRGRLRSKAMKNARAGHVFR